MIEMLLQKVFPLIVGGEVGLSTEEVVACKIVEHLKKPKCQKKVFSCPSAPKKLVGLQNRSQKGMH